MNMIHHLLLPYPTAIQPMISTSHSHPLLRRPPPSHHHHHHHHHVRRRLSLFSTSAATSQTTTPLTATGNSATPTPPAIVIGGGLAGLSAATKLHSERIPFLLLEASDGVGGRVRTDSVDGFLLDRGFHIFITAYPEVRKLLDYSSLNLKKFYSGAKVYYGGEFHTVADPLRHFSDAIGTLTNPIGTVSDKLLIGLTRLRVLRKSDEEIFTSSEVPSIDYLRNSGFSESIIERFFRPFFGATFLDLELETTSRMFEFIFKCLALGDNTLPDKGIGEMPNQLASKLPSDSIRLNSRVSSIQIDEQKGGNSVTVKLESGEELRTPNGVVLAVEEPEVEKLLAVNQLVSNKRVRKPGRSTVCIYFSADRAQIPSPDPVIYLNGSGKGLVDIMYFPTTVAPSYGPPDKSLVSVTLIGSYDDVADDDLVARVVQELSGWFGGPMVRSWNHLRTYRIRFGQPNQSPPTDLMKDPRVGPGLYLCGDYQTNATFDGALVSGRRAVEALLQDRALISGSPRL